MTFGNYIYQDNTSQSRQNAINQLINTADKLEAGHLKAVDAASQLQATIANLDMNEAEDGFKAGLQAELQQTIADNVQYGNMYYALDDIIKKSGDLLSRPDVIGRLKAQKDYQTFRTELEKRTDLPDYLKEMYLDKNKYYYEDKTTEVNGETKIVGGSKWEPIDRPVGYMDDTKIFEEIIKFTRPDVTSGNRLVFKDINGNEVRWDSDDIVTAAIVNNITNSEEKVTGDKLWESTLGLYNHNQAYQAHINQEMKYAEWARNNGDYSDYGLYTSSGIKRSTLEFLQWKFQHSIEGSKYNKLVTNKDVKMLGKNNGNGNRSDINISTIYGDEGGESAGTTNGVYTPTTNITSDELAAEANIDLNVEPE